jgi:hypothetical protein
MGNETKLAVHYPQLTSLGLHCGENGYWVASSVAKLDQLISDASNNDIMTYDTLSALLKFPFIPFSVVVETSE